MLQVYTIYGGDMWREALNGVVTILSSRSFLTLIHIVGIFSVLGVMLAYLKNHNPLNFVKWAAVFVIITMFALIPKRSVQINDITNPAGIYVVDNVPAGLAVIAHLTTSIGYGLAQLFDYTLSRPDSVTYTKTGFLFGSNLLALSTTFKNQDSELAYLLPKYVESCVVGDIMLNHKYTLNELMHSSDPLALITSRPSPLRGLYTQDLNFETCQQAASTIKTRLGIDTNMGGKTWSYYVNRLFGNLPNAGVLMSNMMGESYNYFYRGGESASQIMRNNVVNNAIRQGIKGFGARSNDTSNLVNLASETSLTKMRIGWGTGQALGIRFMPLIQSLLMLMMICLFPLVIALALLNHDMFGLKTLWLYTQTFIYFQMWPVMFAIINFAMNYYLQSKSGSTPLVLSNMDEVALLHSDVANVAGYMVLSIPFIAGVLTKGASALGFHVIGGITNGISGTASQQASTTADGNWSFHNMSMDNIHSNKFDTNFNERHGQQSWQTENGSMMTKTADGQTVFDTSGAMSKLPIHINSMEQATSSLQAQARAAQAQAETHMQGYSQSVSSAWNQLQQLTHQSGSSDSLVHGSDNAIASNQSTAASHMMSAVESYAEANNISQREAFNDLMDKSTRTGVSGDVSASLKFDSDKSALGKIGSIAFGVSGAADVTGRAGWSGNQNSSHGTQVTNSLSNDERHDQRSDAVNDFRRAIDESTSQRISDNASHTDNSSVSHVSQLDASLSRAKSEYQQAQNSLSKSHEYSEMAFFSQSQSAQAQSNYDQAFVNYVQQHSPSNASEILTNTSSTEIAAQRQQLEQSFANDYVIPHLKEDYQQNQQSVNSHIPLSEGDSHGSVRDDFDSHKASLGEGNNVSDQTRLKMTETEHNILNNSRKISNQDEVISDNSAILKSGHKAAEVHQKHGYQQEQAEQNSYFGASAKEALNKTEKLNNGDK